jgi:nucleoside-triphosphatase THEP1
VRDGERRVLARMGTAGDGPQVGPYTFDARALAWANAVLARDLPWAGLLLVDEIGKLELWRGEGLAPILPRGDQPGRGLAGARRSLVLVREALLPELQVRLAGLAPAALFVTRDNRDHLAAEIADRLFGTPENPGAG